MPFLDLGIAQDPMLHATPPDWAHFLPGYGGFRVLTNAILTHTFQARFGDDTQVYPWGY